MHRFVTLLTLIGFIAASLFAPSAYAGFISTDDYVQQARADAQRATVSEMLQQESVRDRMLALGVDPAHIESRLAGLSDAEIAELAERMEHMPAGAGVLESLLIVTLVFVILDIAGVTNVFPFINPAN